MQRAVRLRSVPLEARVRAFAPGRVNLIGEHTDYNEGLCLPFAIEHGVTVTGCPLAGAEVRVRAHDLGEEDRFPAAAPAPERGWRAYVRGTAAELSRAGVEVRSATIDITSDLPPGAGLSSSAALCVALAMALCALSGAETPDRVELARLCSRVESRWVGAQTGLLDQLASLCGRRSQALRIDMRGPTLSHVPLDLEGWRLATLPSGVRREIGASGYNERRAECRAACAALGVAALRDARADDARRLPDPLGRRVRHVLSENERVDVMVEALRHRDPAAAARLLDASHASLRDDYDASVPGVELAVVRAKAAGARGVRMVGGGFGGRVLALFPPEIRLPDDALPVSAGPSARLL